MRTWQWPTYFAIDLPDDWTIEERAGIVEIEPPSRALACHISTARRTKLEPPTAAEAEDLARRFPPLIGAPDISVSVLTLSGHFLASASFVERRETVDIRWELRVRLSQSQLVMWSCDAFGPRASGGEWRQALAVGASLRRPEPIGLVARLAHAVKGLSRKRS